MSHIRGEGMYKSMEADAEADAQPGEEAVADGDEGGAEDAAVCARIGAQCLEPSIPP